MEHHIDRRVILDTESEFKNLYPWSLQELDADGKKIGRDQIPWQYSLSFIATELTFSEGITIKLDYSSDDRADMAVRSGVPSRPDGRGARYERLKVIDEVARASSNGRAQVIDALTDVGPHACDNASSGSFAQVMGRPSHQSPAVRFLTAGRFPRRNGGHVSS